MGSACSIKRVSNQVAPTILELNINENNAQTPKIVFLGIDGSGKSTIITWLERSELGESNHDTFYNPIPKPSSHSSTVTNANNVNVVNCLNNQILLIDVPGNPSQRKYSWINLASKPGVIMIVYVIDQCDVLRLFCDQLMSSLQCSPAACHTMHNVMRTALTPVQGLGTHGSYP